MLLTVKGTPDRPCADRLEKENYMSKLKCAAEKMTLKTLGVILLPFVAFFVIVANIVLPVVGFFFALPVIILDVLLMVAPKSKTCQLLLP
jgi:hypothetical protein